MTDSKKDENDKVENCEGIAEDGNFVVRKKVKSNIMQELAPYASLGLQMVITIVIFAYIGWWIDGKYGTSPWLLIVLTFFGAVAGMVSFLRTVTSKNRKNKILKKDA